jgi:hypothetical protein
MICWFFNSNYFYLKNEWNSDKEGDDTDDEDEELVMLQVFVDPLAEAVFQRSDDYFNRRKLLKFIKMYYSDVFLFNN